MSHDSSYNLDVPSKVFLVLICSLLLKISDSSDVETNMSVLLIMTTVAIVVVTLVAVFYEFLSEAQDAECKLISNRCPQLASAISSIFAPETDGSLQDLVDESKEIELPGRANGLRMSTNPMHGAMEIPRISIRQDPEPEKMEDPETQDPAEEAP